VIWTRANRETVLLSQPSIRLRKFVRLRLSRTKETTKRENSSEKRSFRVEARLTQRRRETARNENQFQWEAEEPAERRSLSGTSKRKAARIPADKSPAAPGKKAKMKTPGSNRGAAFSTAVCKEAETRAQRKRSGDEDQRRWSEGDVGCHPDIVKVNFDGRLTREGTACGELYRARTERVEKPRMKRNRQRGG